MKKIICTGLFVLALSPMTTFTNALDSLVKTNVGQGVCGLPPATEDKSFCSCFLAASTKRCVELKNPPSICNRVHESFIHVAGNNFKNFCTKYADRMPENVDIAECTADLIYYNAYCK